MKSKSTKFSICNSGNFQSPICIEPDYAMEMEDKGDIILNYDSTFLSINDNDNEKKLKICNDGSGYAIINGREFQLKEFHFHVGQENENEGGNEHVIKGQSYKMELHLVHRSQVDRIAAFSIFFKIGCENAALQTILELINKKVTSPIDIDIKQLIPSETVYYHYLGSLTTGNCEENVEWYVFETSIEMSQEQLNIFKEHYHYSVRKPQKLNERKVLKKKVKLLY
ncbi:carbonic anhydrase family protein [Bacillus sp. BPN334]|uniref:carbonic anhydrase family protein n=1 Tax=Bacillus sp. BPN334 TaxID=2217815 RepID=UPI0011ECD0DC|nr:carbonic anhydrase family protein [Bacillus sp. BPN334]KAA0794839.1 carbonic anhydrase family protein [Bacillus sp. BPN334]